MHAEYHSMMSSGRLTLAQKKRQLLIVTVVVVAVAALCLLPLLEAVKVWMTPLDQRDKCPIHNKVAPPGFTHNNESVDTIVNDPHYAEVAVQRLQGAIAIDTSIGDDLPPYSDTEFWQRFDKFHSYLATTFPKLRRQMKVETVNHYGILATWKGSDKSLKPIVLMAHQDVVPVLKDSWDQWDHPPFLGHFDGEYIYGRGTLDCKGQLIAILALLDKLRQLGFKPKRTIIVLLGFDEESLGLEGARHLAQTLEERYGKHSIYAIIDEGTGFLHDEFSGQLVAAPAVAEKGYVDIWTTLTVPGGHSLVPPDHTLLGIMAELETLIEADPYDPLLVAENPFMAHLQCAAVNSDHMLKYSRKQILRAAFDPIANKAVVNRLQTLPYKYYIQTSQAMDVIQGGEKVNALPESVTLGVNYRVTIGQLVDDITFHFANRVRKVAEKYDLTLYAYGDRVIEGVNGAFNVTQRGKLPPSPVTPTKGKAWEVLAGTNRHVIEDLGLFPTVKYPVMTTPSIMTPNSDTRYYWSLTDNIFRFAPLVMSLKFEGVHSVNEKVSLENHLLMIAWYHEYLQAADAAADH